LRHERLLRLVSAALLSSEPGGTRSERRRAALLRRVADTIAELGEVDILDLVMHVEVTEDGNWPSITAYYTNDRPPRSLAVLPR
jgi:hypothetical protein